MTKDLLGRKANVPLTAGHLLVVWDVLANRLSGSEFMSELGEEERRAMWALQDLCEEALTKIGVESRPDSEWEVLMAAAREHVKTVPAEFLN